MKNYFFLLLLITTSVLYKGQEKIIKIDSVTGGSLIIDSENDIISIIKEDQLCKKVTKTDVSPKTNTSKSAINDDDTPAGTSERTQPKTTTSTSTSTKTTKVSSPKNVCGTRNDMPGYMIKVGDVKSEEEINKMISDFRSQFPGLRVEKTYLRPDWRLLAGDYFKKETAQSDLKKIRKNYPTAMVINWRIYCNRAK